MIVSKLSVQGTDRVVVISAVLFRYSTWQPSACQCPVYVCILVRARNKNAVVFQSSQFVLFITDINCVLVVYKNGSADGCLIDWACMKGL